MRTGNQGERSNAAWSWRKAEVDTAPSPTSPGCNLTQKSLKGGCTWPTPHVGLEVLRDSLLLPGAQAGQWLVLPVLILI